MNSSEKNLLDLKHSLYSTKAALFFSIGFGGFLAILFGLIQLTNDILISTLSSLIWLNVFVWIAIKYFVECSKIQEKINKATSKNQ